MAKIVLWNSISSRKRSPTDGFLEDGLVALRDFLRSNNHSLEIVDWQKIGFFSTLCPKPLLYLNRASTKFIFYLAGKNEIYAKVYFPIFAFIQDVVSFFQKRKIKKNLKKLADSLIKSGTKIFGAQVWYGEAFELSDWIASYIKEKDPSVLTIATGFQATLYEEDLLKNSNFDMGIISDEEKPMKIILDIADKHTKNWNKQKVLGEIIKSAESEELLNIIYRKGSKIILTKRYFPDIKNKIIPAYDESDFEGKLRIHKITDAFGCPWGKCNFCTHSHFYRGYLPRDVNNIVDEIELMQKKGIGLFKFTGSETPPQFGAEIAREILNRKLNIKYAVFCRAVHDINDSGEFFESIVNNFELMLKAGLVSIFIGGECANDRINKEIMNKEANREDIINTVKAFRKAQERTGVKAYAGLALIYPTPLLEGITLEDVFNDDFALIKEIEPDTVIVSPSTPFKNTAWYKDKKRFGFSIPEDFINKFIKYEYVLYKPPSFWPSMGNVSLNGMGFKKGLEECERLRRAVEDLGIPTDISDDCFLVAVGSGYEGKDGLMKFKRETSLDLVSADYQNIKRITEAVNKYSTNVS